ncbi:tyrosine-type recombinase/integrase [Glaciecola sp. 2405UD65-10]|uniref:tyrosine-type recombinase/integrase n=1 Tax=Glaciecola sp. 2405UD65-10 TaxID=3397244 RepID=UPI003B5A1615
MAISLYSTHMQYHPLTDATKLQPVQRGLLSTPEFSSVYPTLNEFLELHESKGIQARADVRHLLNFLVTGLSNAKGTQNRFRNEAERLMLFCWNERNKSVLEANLEDIKLYIDWLWKPPKRIIADTTIASRFKSKPKSDVRLVNPEWRPFVLRRPKANRKVEMLIEPKTTKLQSKHAYRLTQTSLQNSYAALSVYFKFLFDAELVRRNYVTDAKKSCKYLVKGKVYQPPHTFDDDTWDLFIDCLTKAANENPRYELHRFVVLTLKVLFLRISELSQRDYYTPLFNHFRPDSSGEGWVLNVIGKGKKERLVTVPDSYIDNVLSRYRVSLGLTPLPRIDEDSPIIPSLKTGAPLRQDSLNNIVEEAFDLVIRELVKSNKKQQALSIAGASSHWLRHTGATQALDELNETMLAEELGHASVKTTVEVYVAPAHRDRIRKGATRKL